VIEHSPVEYLVVKPRVGEDRLVDVLICYVFVDVCTRNWQKRTWII